MDPETLADLFSAFGPMRARRMFGGAGLYADGVMFALEIDGLIYLKADAALAALLAEQGSAPFSYVAKTGPRTMNGFWRLPDAALDEPELLADLARRALDVAQRAAAEKAQPRTGPRRAVRGPKTRSR